MPTEWRVRPEISRHRRFAASPIPVLVTLLLVLMVGWQATSADPWRFLAPSSQGQPSIPVDDATRSELEQFRAEIVGLQQEIQDLNDQVRQKVAANVSANEQLQNFAALLATEQHKFLAAIEQRDTAVHQLGALRSDLELACKLLRDQPPARHASPATITACGGGPALSSALRSDFNR
jgi:TolA-binding protein